MSGGMLAFEAKQFDSAITIGILHHLPDQLVLNMVSESMRVLKPGSSLHIVDAVLPEILIKSPLNTAMAYLDRGCCPRKGSYLTNLIKEHFHIDRYEIAKQFPHNIIHIQISANHRL
jgi:ubiquinone/menaquinone biosynthesis C-methylase UbiE